jgi:molecular chaperone GrpE
MKAKQDWKSGSDPKNETAGEANDAILKDQTEVLPDAETEEKDPISKLEAELTHINDKYLRLYSDFENYKRRVAKDRIEQTKMASADIFLSLLPIIDDLERALKSVDETNEKNSVIEGIKLIYSKIKSITASKGLTEMNSVGKPFDPELHDAIANIPAPSEGLKGKVVEETEKGYFLNDRVIRHAKVIVGN